jgi:hypothetical protein
MRINRFNHRFVAAGIAALAIGAAASGAVSAQSSTTPTSLHLVARSAKGVGFFPKGRPHQGDRIGFGDKVSGDDTGFDRASCTLVGTSLVCNVVVELSKGTLDVQGIAPQTAKNSPLAIVGGTGIYDGARGTVFATDHKSSTDLDVELKP